jgi:hypothetical protein
VSSTTHGQSTYKRGLVEVEVEVEVEAEQYVYFPAIQVDTSK